ncbi:plasmid mobilization relaxosome protein MobC [Segetibacter sp. 3557_3]|uniref:plasmid mobilization protein n=1 Tax=Segetibacter sp. 3557_3 TaxID=2547429 RepID=UPI001058A901|nr:plasmid mobilization relaxosome protein MobC [Segetibacter sp. 3557_3]TDH28085.1 plasmid mobilization relaxosome protein MobC [Segetibacter sp. 3557_3]
MNTDQNTRTKWLHLRLKPTEYTTIHNDFSKTTCRKLSEYARKILLKKTVTIKVRDQSMDDYMSELILLKNELNNIGNNFNQAVKRLHKLDKIPEFRAWILTYEVEKNILIKRVNDIKIHVQKMGEKWLQ